MFRIKVNKNLKMEEATYYPGLYSWLPYSALINETGPLFHEADQLGKSGSTVTGRYSFLVSRGGKSDYLAHLHSVSFEKCPLIDQLRIDLETRFNFSADYCLVHLYMDGDSGIGWHSDKEALTTPVVSISFGATREFRFRNIGQTRGWSHSFQLGSGDLIIMYPGCQEKYEHSIAKSKRVTSARINLTFTFWKFFMRVQRRNPVLIVKLGRVRRGDESMLRIVLFTVTLAVSTTKPKVRCDR